MHLILASLLNCILERFASLFAKSSRPASRLGTYLTHLNLGSFSLVLTVSINLQKDCSALGANGTLQQSGYCTVIILLSE